MRLNKKSNVTNMRIKSPQITSAALLAVIQKADSYEECAPQFSSGECGVFAVALREFLGAGDHVIVSGSHYEMFDHVAIKWANRTWDGSGNYDPPKHGSELYDEGKAEDYTVEVTEMPHTQSTCQAILRYTDSDAPFATGATSDKILDLLHRAHAEVMDQQASSLSIVGGIVHDECLHPSYHWIIRNLDEPSSTRETSYGDASNPSIEIEMSYGVVRSVAQVPANLSLVITNLDVPDDSPTFQVTYTAQP